MRAVRAVPLTDVDAGAALAAGALAGTGARAATSATVAVARGAFASAAARRRAVRFSMNLRE